MSHQDFNRMDRVSEVIQKALSEIITQRLQDPRVGMLTIEAVALSKDFSHAKIFVSVLEPQKAEKILEGLNSAKGFLRTQLGKKVALRVVPQLRFIYDETAHRAAHLTKLIEKAVAEDGNNIEKKEP